MSRADRQGGGIAYEAVGRRDAEGIVLVHSLGHDRSMWRPQVDVLAFDHRVVTVDLPGHGASDSPPGPYTVGELAGGVFAAADDAGLVRFHLCGISIGGQVALWAAIEAPDRLMSVVVANTAARIGTAEGWRDRIAAVRTEGMGRLSETVVPRWFAPGFAETHAAEYADALEVFLTTSPNGYIGCCQALEVSDMRAAVGGISVPTLVIGGELDLSTPPDEARWLHSRIGGSELTIFREAAHLSNLDVPDAFTERLRRFIESG